MTRITHFLTALIFALALLLPGLLAPSLAAAYPGEWQNYRISGLAVSNPGSVCWSQGWLNTLHTAAIDESGFYDVRQTITPDGYPNSSLWTQTGNRWFNAGNYNGSTGYPFHMSWSWMGSQQGTWPQSYAGRTIRWTISVYQHNGAQYVKIDTHTYSLFLANC